jgi:nitric oxide reductase large subunit
MTCFNLFPLGIVQLYHAVDTGYWHARSLDFSMLFLDARMGSGYRETLCSY